MSESEVLKHNTEQKHTQHITPLEILHPQDALHYDVDTQRAEREHYSWPCLTRPPGFLKSLPVLRRAMSSAQVRLAVCEQRNGGAS